MTPGKRSVLEGARSIRSLFAGRRNRVLLSILLSCLHALALFPVALLLRRVIDEALPGHDVPSLLALSSEMAGMVALSAALQLANRHVSHTAIKAVTSDLRSALVSAQLGGTRMYHSREDHDAVHSHIVQDTIRVETMANAVMLQCVPAALISTGLLAVLVRMNAQLSLACLVSFPFFAVFSVAAARRLKSLIKDFHRDFTVFSKGVAFILACSELIRVSSSEAFERQRQLAAISGLRESHSRAHWFSALITIVQQHALLLTGVIVLLAGGLLVIRGALTLGELLAFYAALGLLNSYLSAAASSVPSIIEGLESLSALHRILDTEDFGITAGSCDAGRALPEDCSQAYSGSRMHAPARIISCEGVDFRYAAPLGGSDPGPFLLKNIEFSISIETGQTVTICGASGSGKTTLMYLLLGFYRPCRGRILIDGIPLSELDIAHYRRRIGVVFQDPLLFAGTIRENLTYGLQSCDERELVEICRQVLLHDQIARLPLGYDSPVGDHGMLLSGGQRQRLAIARALLRKPGVLILDEPTNHLDESCVEGMRFLWERRPGCACIVISHNKILQRNAGRSYVLENGELRLERPGDPGPKAGRDGVFSIPGSGPFGAPCREKQIACT